MVETKEDMNRKNKDDKWTDECEELLAEWSEKASCYRWLHGRCEKSYRKWYYCFSIPVIILSTLTGAANVGMDSFVPAESKSIASAIVGGVNIFAGIISTLQNFLKVAELMEAHRIAGVSWGKLQRNIAIELALDPARRVVQSDFLSVSRSEYDRLIEAGPIIDDGVIRLFNSKFKNYEVAIPSICNGLDKCNIYKIDENIKMDPEEFIDGIEDVIMNQKKEMEEETGSLSIKVPKGKDNIDIELNTSKVMPLEIKGKIDKIIDNDKSIQTDESKQKDESNDKSKQKDEDENEIKGFLDGIN